ncbi:MAG: hypothetical protein FJ010_02755 [Chloroflexi bacterium]|nr:hypothetical protein [Chloroflexota bacterium]
MKNPFRRLNKQQLISSIAFLLCITSLGVALWWIYQYSQIERQHKARALDYAQHQATLVASQINEKMRKQKDIADGIAGDLSSGELPHTGIKPRLLQEMTNHPEYYGAAAAFAPYSYAPTVNLHAPYYHKDEHGQFVFTAVEDVYDYTDPRNAKARWYTNTIQQDTGQWYYMYGAASKSIIVFYVTPFYSTDLETGRQTQAGVVAIVHSLNSFVASMREVDIGEEGYAAISDENNRFIWHYNQDFMGKTTAEVAALLEEMAPAWMKETVRTEASKSFADYERMSQGESFYRERLSSTGQLSWTFFQPLVAQGWGLAVVIFKDIMAADATMTIRQLVNIGLATMSFLCSLSVLIFRAKKGEINRIWKISAVVSLVLFAGIAWIWYIVYSISRQESNQSVLTDQANIENILQEIDANAMIGNLPPPIRVPTGMMIEYLEIKSSTVTLSGYLWQKYPQELPEGVVKEARFPAQVGRLEIREAYHFEQGGDEIIGWFFHVTLQQKLDVSRYPLDQVTMQIQIDPGKLGQNIVLVPDFESYEFMMPSHKPGLNLALWAPQWDLQRSFFGYRVEDYNADFGGAIELQKSTLPALIFNIIARRELVSPVIAYCIVILLVAVQLFGANTISSKSAFDVLSVGAALFFGAAIAHNNLRTNIMYSGVTYLEYYFILLYVTILAGTINGLMVRSNANIAILQYEDNLIFKLCYWPCFMGTAFLITLFTFYPR